MPKRPFTCYNAHMKTNIVLGCLLALVAAGCAQVSAEKPRQMTFGVCGSLEIAASLKEEGWDFFEGRVSDILHPELSDADWAPYAEKAKACPLPIRSLNCFLPGTERLVGPNTTHEHALAWAVTACRRADELGIPYIVFGSGGARRVPEGFSKDEAHRQFVDFCRKLAKRIDGMKVTLVLEPLNVKETNFLNREAEGVRLVDEIASPRIRLLADFYHMLMDGESAESVWLAGARLKHVHVAENRSRLEPKTEADFRPYFAALRQIGYAGGVSCECGFSNEPDARKNTLKRLRMWAGM